MSISYSNLHSHQVSSHTSTSQCLCFVLIWWQKKELSHCFNLQLSHLRGWVTFHIYWPFAFPLAWINSSYPLPIFLLVLGFFLINLWDLAYIGNIDAQLNAENITDNYMTLARLIRLLWAKGTAILNWGFEIIPSYTVLLENAVQENTVNV